VNRRLVMAGVAASAALGFVVPSFAASTGVAAQKLPVTVVHNDQGTGVGAGEVGVWVGNDGRVCPGVSTQDWPCVGGNG
jgi:hypothetical protein